MGSCCISLIWLVMGSTIKSVSHFFQGMGYVMETGFIFEVWSQGCMCKVLCLTRLQGKGSGSREILWIVYRLVLTPGSNRSNGWPPRRGNRSIYTIGFSTPLLCNLVFHHRFSRKSRIHSSSRVFYSIPGMSTLQYAQALYKCSNTDNR